jgi:hypothetical protein
MTKPPTLIDAEERGLLADDEKGIHTFSNGTEHELWADVNCWECRFYSEDQAGEHCAFEGAALLGSVSPELARLFGWIESAEYPGEFDAPESCAFFRERQDDDGNDIPVPPDPDPRQLVLIADPREDAAMVRQPVQVPVLLPQHAHARADR